MNDILSMFPFKSIRPQQQQALEFIQDNIHEYDNIILDLPTGVGKSAIAIAAQRMIDSMFDGYSPNEYEEGCYMRGMYLLTTQRVLQEQYQAEFHDMRDVPPAEKRFGDEFAPRMSPYPLPAASIHLNKSPGQSTCRID